MLYMLQRSVYNEYIMVKETESPQHIFKGEAN